MFWRRKNSELTNIVSQRIGSTILQPTQAAAVLFTGHKCVTCHHIGMSHHICGNCKTHRKCLDHVPGLYRPGKIWKVTEFKVEIFEALKSLQNDPRYGKVWSNPWKLWGWPTLVNTVSCICYLAFILYRQHCVASILISYQYRQTISTHLYNEILWWNVLFNPVRLYPLQDFKALYKNCIIIILLLLLMYFVFVDVYEGKNHVEKFQK